MATKLFKNSDGILILQVNNEKKRTLKRGEITFEYEDQNVILRFSDYLHLHAGNEFYTGPVTGIVKENNEPYSSVADFLTKCSDFFKVEDINNYFQDLIDAIETNKTDNAGIIEAIEDNKTDSQGIIAAVQNSGGVTYKSFSVEITRPANQTPYSPGDVVADVSAAFIQLANVAKSAGTGVHITRIRIQTDDTGVSGTKFNLHLYREAPTFIADNAAFAVAYANATKRVGAIPVVMGTGNQNTIGMNDYNQVILNPVARDVYWILETVTGFTPSANSTKFTIAIDCELSNS